MGGRPLPPIPKRDILFAACAMGMGYSTTGAAALIGVTRERLNRFIGSDLSARANAARSESIRHGRTLDPHLRCPGWPTVAGFPCAAGKTLDALYCRGCAIRQSSRSGAPDPRADPSKNRTCAKCGASKTRGSTFCPPCSYLIRCEKGVARRGGKCCTVGRTKRRVPRFHRRCAPLAAPDYPREVASHCGALVGPIHATKEAHLDEHGRCPACRRWATDRHATHRDADGLRRVAWGREIETPVRIAGAA